MGSCQSSCCHTSNGIESVYTEKQSCGIESVYAEKKASEGYRQDTWDESSKVAMESKREEIGQDTDTPADSLIGSDESSDAEMKTKLESLLKNHDVFEAYELCPSYVEEKGLLKTYRETVEILLGSKDLTWERTIKGDLGEGNKYFASCRWDGATPGSGGNEYLWVKIGMDQGIPWWKSQGAFHEPDLDVKGNVMFADAWMVGKPDTTCGLRCNIQGFFGKLFGYTQDYLMVNRYLNKETGFCIEKNMSVDHEELERQGYDVGKKKYKKGNDILVYVMSFPRTENKSTNVIYLRAKMYVPNFLLNLFCSTLGPSLLSRLLPQMVEKQKSSPDYQARFAEDKQGLYARFKNFQKQSLVLAEDRIEEYSASNLPPPNIVMGSFAQPKVGN